MLRDNVANIIEVTGLSKKFGKKEAVSDVNFSIGANQIFGFIGPNGAGKTTTIRMILGLLRPDRGTIRIFDRAVDGNRRDTNRKIGFMLHDPGLSEELSCYENLYYYADIYDVEKQRIEHLLKEMDLWDSRGLNTGNFSRGMKQKAVLARALLHDPDILILDEPATGLDPEMQVWMRTYLLGLARQGKTILISSHNLFEIQQICSHIGIIYNGKLIKSGSIEELQRETSRITIEIEIDDPVRIKNYNLSSYVNYCVIDGRKITATLSKEDEIPMLVKYLSDSNFKISNMSRKIQSVEELYLKFMEGARQ